MQSIIQFTRNKNDQDVEKCNQFMKKLRFKFEKREYFNGSYDFEFYRNLIRRKDVNFSLRLLRVVRENIGFFDNTDIKVRITIDNRCILDDIQCIFDSDSSLSF